MKKTATGILIAVALFAALLLSQATESITGVVSDPAGAVVPNVTVQLKSVATGATLTTRTDQAGKYTFNVPPGTYELTINAPGFKSYVAKSIVVATGNPERWNVALQTGSSSDAVTASAGGGPGGGGGGRAGPAAKGGAGGGAVAGGVGNGIGYGVGAGRAAPMAAAPPPAPKDLGQYRLALPYPQPNTAEYESYGDNEFASTTSAPLSTFSADVDTASYSNVRRFLTQGQLPPADAVRVEELVNYFSYNYPLPEAGKPVSMTTQYTTDPWNPQRKLMLVGMRTQPISSEELPPSNLTFLIDVSGSMSPAERLPLIKQALKMLARQLRRDDRVSIVVYAGAAGLVLPPTSGDHQREILDALDRLQAGGSTNGADGIRLAYRTARQAFVNHGNNRVILATDGDFNVGVSSDDELVRLIERERESGIFLSVLGVGTDNLKDAKMEKLADHGNGNYAYIDNIREAHKVLIQQMGATLVTVAKDVKLQVEFNPVHVKAWRLVGYEDRLLKPEDFNNDRKDAGDLGAGHQVTALYEIIPPGSSEEPGGVDRLRYQKNDLPRTSHGNELAWVKLRYKQPQSDLSRLLEWPVSNAEVAFRNTPQDTRFAAAVAEFGLLLRKSKFAGSASFDHVLRTATEAMGPDLDGYRSEFLGLVRRARTLAGL